MDCISHSLHSLVDDGVKEGKRRCTVGRYIEGEVAQHLTPNVVKVGVVHLINRLKDNLVLWQFQVMIKAMIISVNPRTIYKNRSYKLKDVLYNLMVGCDAGGPRLYSVNTWLHDGCHVLRVVK